MDRKAQGAIEYLLIIGAAILIVAIVILAVTGILSGGQTAATGANSDVNTANSGLSDLQCKSNCSAMTAGGCCGGSTTVVGSSGTYCTVKTASSGCVLK